MAVDAKEQGTKEDKDNPFSQYYAQLLHQQNMLQDTVRTGAYQAAIRDNAADFTGKVVLDVGTGSGILAFFAAQTGAKKVYAVEASAIAESARLLVEHNGMSSVIQVIQSKLEEVELPEKVDVIVSEPIGFLLVHERMLDTYIKSRDKFLKPGGIMMPAGGDIVVAPMTSEALYQEQLIKASFWQSTSFFGLDVSVLQERALDEHFGQPVVGYFYSSSLISTERAKHHIDFSSATLENLLRFTMPLRFTISRTSIMHGLGCWFDLSFQGSQAHVVLSTSPDSPGTHWYQCRLLLKNPIAVNATQVVTGSMEFEANDRFSYCITMTLTLEGTSISSTQRINLQDQMYHYLTNAESAAAR